MKIKFFKSIKKDLQVNQQVLALMKKHDKDFVPPLSHRGSTTQGNLDHLPEGNIENYFNEMLEQEFFIAFNEKQVVGFMTFRKNFVSPVIKDANNIYISTIIVDEDYRGRGITKDFYRLCLHKYKQKHIFTRTWSQNMSHIGLLAGIHFTEFHRIPDDRGKGIDTVYYKYQRRKRTPSEVITHYQLWGSCYFLGLLFLLTILSFLAMIFIKENLWSDICSNIATSLLASFLCLLCDSAVRYREAVRDEYINSLKNYGISNLRFEKSVLLESLIPTVKEELWISGYRLAMTAKEPFLDALKKALEKNQKLKVKILVVPPCFDTYSKVYGDDDVLNNYIRLFKTLKEYGKDDNIQIHVTDMPLFNDTYRVDSRIVTSPFLHATYEDGTKLEAKDFFTIDITDVDSRLHQLIEGEYNLLWDHDDTQNFDYLAFLEEEITQDTWRDIFEEHCHPLRPLLTGTKG